MSKLNKWVASCHALVLGSGLGREPNLHPHIVSILQSAIGKIWVWDADMLWFLTEGDSNGEIARLLKENAERTILTPNFVETSRLCNKFGIEMPKQEEETSRKSEAGFIQVELTKHKEAAHLCSMLGNPLMICRALLSKSITQKIIYSFDLVYIQRGFKQNSQRKG
jgi:NAD(P)H-hydrate repair Nnr-like enzyme with NAD(P)H-hydrate dehydratase domain